MAYCKELMTVLLTVEGSIWLPIAGWCKRHPKQMGRFGSPSPENRWVLQHVCRTYVPTSLHMSRPHAGSRVSQHRMVFLPVMLAPSAVSRNVASFLDGESCVW